MNFVRNESFKLVLLCSAASLLVLVSYSRLVSPQVPQLPEQDFTQENSVYNELLQQINQLHDKLGQLTNFQATEETLPATPDSPLAPNPVALARSQPISLEESIKAYEDGTCKESNKIYFLKTSKTGSTSVANLLMRFGLRRPGTTFLMGETANGGFFFENQYMPFNAETCYLGRNIEPRPVYDISYVHMRYNKTAINHLMHPDHKVCEIKLLLN